MLEELVQQYLQDPKVGKRTPNEYAALNKLIRYVSKNELDFYRLTSEDFDNILGTVKATREETLRKAQRGLIKFYEWLVEQGADVNETLAVLKQTVMESRTTVGAFHKEWYFDSYKSMIEHFYRFAEQADLSDPDRYAAYFTFAWFGLERNEIAELKTNDVTLSPDGKSVVVKNITTIRNPLAIKIIMTHMRSPGFTASNGKFYAKKPSEYFFSASCNFKKNVSMANERSNYERRFSYDGVARSAMYLKAYDSLRALMIPIKINTGKTHPRIVMALLKLSEYNAPEVQGSFLMWSHFYEWCKVFREVDDMPPS